MRIWIFILIMLLFFIFSPKQFAFAQSSYVLPYPSEMPGSKLYKAFVLWDELMAYWYFGNLSQFTYSLEQSDKYLVEAKTLFEYKQYYFADNALKESDEYFHEAKRALDRAAVERKDIKDKKTILREAAKKHIEVLESSRNRVPETFLWQPEKSQPTMLSIGSNLSQSISVRKSCF